MTSRAKRDNPERESFEVADETQQEEGVRRIMKGRDESAPPPPETFEEAARRIQEEGEAVPFDDVLRRLVKARPKHDDKKGKSGPRRRSKDQ